MDRVVLAEAGLELECDEVDVDVFDRVGRPGRGARKDFDVGLNDGNNSGAIVSGFAIGFHGSENSDVNGSLDDPGVVPRDQVG